MGVRCWVERRERADEIESVVDDEENCDYERLRDFDAVDPGEDVDAVGTEDGDGGHVDVVEEAEVEEPA